jgi:hypothetical protein
MSGKPNVIVVRRLTYSNNMIVISNAVGVLPVFTGCQISTTVLFMKIFLSLSLVNSLIIGDMLSAEWIGLAALVISILGSLVWLIFQAGTLVNLVRDMKVNVDKIPGIDLRLSVVEVKVDRLENKVDRLENKFNRLHNKINSIGHK